MAKVNEAIKCGTELTLDVYTTFKTHGRTFKVVLFGGINFCTIEDTHITDGRLNTPLYMNTLRPSPSLDACMRQTYIDCEAEELMEQGIVPMVACAMAATGLDEKTVRSKLAIA